MIQSLNIVGHCSKYENPIVLLQNLITCKEPKRCSGYMLNLTHSARMFLMYGEWRSEFALSWVHHIYPAWVRTLYLQYLSLSRVEHHLEVPHTGLSALIQHFRSQKLCVVLCKESQDSHLCFLQLDSSNQTT